MLNNEITTKELMRYLKGPDFPTGGIVINKDELEDIYETGTGKIKLRGKVEFQKGKAGKTNVVITEIPYTMIGANIAKFYPTWPLFPRRRRHRICGYFQPIFQGRHPYRHRTS